MNTDTYDRILLDLGFPYALASKFLPIKTKEEIDAYLAERECPECGR